MKAPILYRISSVLLLLFAAGHTFGFRQNNPEWGADAVLGLMRSVHFDAQGFTRTYWDFFSAFGLFFSVFLLFAAVLAWLLGGLPAETLLRVRSIAWALAICFVAALSPFATSLCFTLFHSCRNKSCLPRVIRGVPRKRPTLFKVFRFNSGSIRSGNSFIFRHTISLFSLFHTLKTASPLFVILTQSIRGVVHPSLATKQAL